jgi:hypothetical protein
VPAFGGGTVRVEAEAPGNTIAGAARIASCGACSGGERVGYIGNGAANYLTVNNIQESTAGPRTLTIDYLLSGSRSFYIRVNGGPDIQVALTGSSFSTVASTSIPITLQAGANSLTFHNDSAYAPDLDLVAVS